MATTPAEYLNLREFATVRQHELLDALASHGSQRKAAKAVGLSERNFMASLARLRNKAAMRGVSPEHGMTHACPDGFKLKGTSTLYGEDGAIKAQWVKTTADADAREQMLRAVVGAMAEDVPRVMPLAAPAQTSADLCNLYTLTDCHVGMLAWHKEGGADWDLKIAEETLFGAFEFLVLRSPAARVGIVNQLGDWLHSDGLLAVTPTSGHVLDQDGRFGKLIGVAVRLIRRMVDLALQKHERVELKLAEGNHDMASSAWLRVMFAALYENEPRVRVDASELPYYVYQHGKTLLGFHHGHLKKNDQLPLLFAAQYPQLWGATTKRYCHTGHRHHVEEKEHSGMTVLQHSTLAARDAYAARGGWHSERQATAITYHSEYGEVARTTVTPEMLVSTRMH